MSEWTVVPKRQRGNALVGCISVTDVGTTEKPKARVAIANDVFDAMGYPTHVLLLANGSRFALAPTTDKDLNARRLGKQRDFGADRGVLPAGRHPATVDDEGRAIFEPKATR